MVESAQTNLAGPSETVLTSALPFAFAQSRGVLLEKSASSTTLYYVPPLATEVLLEVQRHLGGSFSLEPVPDDVFRQRLTLAYQRTQNEAAQMAEDLSSDVDLSRLVEELPDVGDLMDAEDDAPIIRLINAIVSQAVKAQASDIHIETFEECLSVRSGGWCVGRGVIAQAHVGAPAGLAAKGHGKAGYRREACAAGWSYFRPHRRTRHRHQNVHHPFCLRRARGAPITR